MAINSIVLADDESIQRDTLSTIIQRYVSADIRLCSNGRDALSLIEEELPDLLITDIRMPVMDGMELIKEVSSRYPSLKTVLISAYSEFSYAKTAITCGVSEYLLKPFRPEEIRKLLEKLDAEISAAQAQSLWDRLQKKAATNQQLMALSASLYGLPLPAGKETDLSASRPAQRSSPSLSLEEPAKSWRCQKASPRKCPDGPPTGAAADPAVPEFPRRHFSPLKKRAGQLGMPPSGSVAGEPFRGRTSQKLKQFPAEFHLLDRRGFLFYRRNGLSQGDLPAGQPAALLFLLLS